MAHGETLAVRGKPDAERRPFGSEWKKEFLFDPTWRNLNHGSFGTYPLHIRDKLRGYQDRAEARPDQFIRYDQPGLLDEARGAVARLVKAPVDTVVFVGNATEGVNTVLRNLAWDEDGRDVILSFSTVYEACGKAADYLVEYFGARGRGGGGGLEHRSIEIAYPLEDDEITAAFREAVRRVRDDDGKRARVAVLDVVSSRPGVAFPWVDVVAACRELGVLSLVDGAQGVGMVPLDLGAADPDFFVSNCHKWLHVPRGCAVLYTPERNQGLLRTTLATSHGYTPRRRRDGDGDEDEDDETTTPTPTPLPPKSADKSAYVSNFEFVGTRDNAPYLCVKDAIAWREDVCGGEERVLEYLWALNKKGIRTVADALGTEYLDNAKGTLTDCAMGNVALPVVWAGGGGGGAGAKETDVVVPEEHRDTVLQWMGETLVRDYRTFMSQFIMGDRYWVRLSAQIYLDEGDYEAGAAILKELCRRIGKREYLRE